MALKNVEKLSLEDLFEMGRGQKFRVTTSVNNSVHLIADSVPLDQELQTVKMNDGTKIVSEDGTWSKLMATDLKSNMLKTPSGEAFFFTEGEETTGFEDFLKGLFTEEEKS